MNRPPSRSGDGAPGDGAHRMADTPQLPLALRYSPDQRLQTYVGAPSGALAQLAALARGEGDAGVYLGGNAGTGKTHLALAVCAAAESAGRRAGYLPLRSAGGRLSEALQAYADDAGANVDLLAIDGLEHVAGNRADEIALFDFHNRARGAGIGLLYAARSAPDSLPLVLPDLRSRLGQCTRIVLKPLDDAGRRAVMRERAQRRGLVLEDAALDWLLTRSGRDLAGLTAVLERLDHASLAAQRRITVPFLRKVLGTAQDK